MHFHFFLIHTSSLPTCLFGFQSCLGTVIDLTRRARVDVALACETYELTPVRKARYKRFDISVRPHLRLCQLYARTFKG